MVGAVGLVRLILLFGSVIRFDVLLMSTFLHKKSKLWTRALRDLTETTGQLTGKFGILIAALKEKGEYHYELYLNR